jgi:HEAT repeat protein
VRVFAIRMLGEISDPAGVPALLERITRWKGEELREALIAMGKGGDERALPVLLQYLASSEAALQRAAAVGLGALGSPEPVEALAGAVVHGALPVRRAAAEALALIAPAGRERLSALLDADDPTARAVAMEILDEDPAFEVDQEAMQAE